MAEIADILLSNDTVDENLPIGTPVGSLSVTYTQTTVMVGSTEYNTTVIGDLEWTTENLAEFSGSYMYPGDDIANVPEYGLLYRYSTALSLAPSGWRLPSQADYQNLVSETGVSSGSAGGYLKDPTSLWDDPTKLYNNDLGFSAKATGEVWGQDPNNGYVPANEGLGSFANFHTSTVSPTGSQWRYVFTLYGSAYDADFVSEWVQLENANRRNFAVRYVRDV